MQRIYPSKLKPGDEIRVIAPSRSLALINKETRKIADERFKELGLKISFGMHVEEIDVFSSSSVASRLEDLHDAFSDQNIKAILTVIGGFNSNQLLKGIDWDVLHSNPKIFCGFSDITALNDAILAKTGLITYSGPHYSTFGMQQYFEYVLKYFKRCLMAEEPYELQPVDEWTDDPWFLDQSKRNPIKNEGWWVVNEGAAEGGICGGNISTFSLLQGTEYMPPLKNTILFIEDDAESHPQHFDRDLMSLIHQPDFEGVRGIIIGRFQRESGMTRDLLTALIRAKKELNNIPVIGNVDFGHTNQIITYPIGGTAKFVADATSAHIVIVEH